MSEILSQSEIDALLNDIKSGEIPPEQIAKEVERDKIKKYDF